MHTPLPHAFDTNPKNPIRIGVVGLGRAGIFFHCRPLHILEEFRLVAVCDSRPEVSVKVAKEHHCESFTNYTDMLALPDIDLIVIATPTVFHHGQALQAIAAGKSVLVEKPFAPSAQEAEEIFAAGKKANVFVGAYHNRRFDPDVLALRKILDEGKLGPIVKVSIHLHSYSRRCDWQTSRHMGGGALANWGAHALDWAFFLFGPHFTCPVARLMHVLNPGDAEDSFHIFLEQPDGPYVDIEYFNCAAKSLPKWHVVGRYGSALSHEKTFQIRFCEPSAMVPLKSDGSTASDGTYGFKEDLNWKNEIVEWGHWDNCPPFYKELWQHLKHGKPVPVQACEVIRQLQLMNTIRKEPLRSYLESPPVPIISSTSTTEKAYSDLPTTAGLGTA